MDHRIRDHRPRAYNIPGHAHELTFSCFKRLTFLSKERTCKWLAEAIRNATLTLDYSLWAYVFMPDHVHLVVYPNRAEYDDSDFLKKIKEPVSRKAISFLKREHPEWLNRIRTRHGSDAEYHFWQPGRGYDRNIDDGKTLQKVIEYIHLNPVRKGFVERSCDWKWSSAGWADGCPLNDLKVDRIPPEWLVGVL